MPDVSLQLHLGIVYETQGTTNIWSEKKRLLEKDETNGVIMFWWWSEFEDVSCLLCTTNAIELSEMRAEATENDLAKLSEERLWLFGHDIDMDVYYMFLYCASCSNEWTSVWGSIAHLAHLELLIATAPEWYEKRELMEHYCCVTSFSSCSSEKGQS